MLAWYYYKQRSREGTWSAFQVPRTMARRYGRGTIPPKELMTTIYICYARKVLVPVRCWLPRLYTPHASAAKCMIWDSVSFSSMQSLHVGSLVFSVIRVRICTDDHLKVIRYTVVLQFLHLRTKSRWMPLDDPSHFIPFSSPVMLNLLTSWSYLAVTLPENL